MAGKLVRLPPAAQEALQWLAALGNTRGFGHARAGSGRGRGGHACRALGGGAGPAWCCGADETYAFLHDRVQEAAYSLIPEAARAMAHLRIGRMLAA